MNDDLFHTSLCPQMPTSRYWKGIFHSSYTLPPLFEWATLRALIPASLSLFCANVLETMVAINVADKYTSVDSEQDRVFYGQGVANIASGLMAGMGGSGIAISSYHGLRMGGVTSLSVFFAGVFMLCTIILFYHAVAFIPLGAVMGISLHLVLSMFQWSPIVALVLKCVPNACFLRWPSLAGRNLATPDIFSTWVTAILAMCASTYCLAGYLLGVLCYACDPIGHAIISSSAGSCNYIELILPNHLVPSSDKSFNRGTTGGTKGEDEHGIEEAVPADDDEDSGIVLQEAGAPERYGERDAKESGEMKRLQEYEDGGDASVSIDEENWTDPGRTHPSISMDASQDMGICDRLCDVENQMPQMRR